MFTTGAGFSNIVGSTIAQRLSICGFMVFNNVHFYDYMLFPGCSSPARRQRTLGDVCRQPKRRDRAGGLTMCVTPSSTVTKIMAFTKRGDSALARLADIVFVIDGSKQTLVGSLPNPFFGHVILAFE